MTPLSSSLTCAADFHKRPKGKNKRSRSGNYTTTARRHRKKIRDFEKQNVLIFCDHAVSLRGKQNLNVKVGFRLQKHDTSIVFLGEFEVFHYGWQKRARI